MRAELSKVVKSSNELKLVLTASSLTTIPIVIYGWSIAKYNADLWTFLVEFSLLLVTAALLLWLDHPLSYAGAMTFSGCLVYRFSQAVVQEWNEYTGAGLEGVKLWSTVARQSWFPVWEGMNGGLGLLIFCYAGTLLVKSARGAFCSKHQ